MRHLLYHHTSHSLKEPSDDEARKQGITQDIYYKCHEHIHNVNRFKKKKTENKRASEKRGKAGAWLLHLRHRRMLLSGEAEFTTFLPEF